MPAEIAAAVPWNIRTAALLEIAGELGARAAAAPNGRQRSALLALRCLSAFAAKQFDLFGKGFAAGMLETDKQFPPRSVLEATACQVALDIDVLLRTLGQRDEAMSTAAMRTTLGLADQLAALALAPAVRSRLMEETAVLTYFQKTATIRLIPYVPLALIGIDLSATRDSTRLLAIAHEAGHHVYRQMNTNYQLEDEEQGEQRPGKQPGKKPDKQGGKHAPAAQPSSTPGWLAAWSEELFADVYSVLVAGPVAGLSVQAMLAAEAPSNLLQDDADHPLPALRPEIAIAVLRKLAAGDKHDADRLGQTADLLQQQWHSYLADQQVGSTFAPADGGKPLALAEARSALHRYVDGLLEDELAALVRDAGHRRWSKGVAAAAGLPDLYTQFTSACSHLDAVRVPELEAAGEHKVAVTPQIAGVRGGQRVVGEIGDPQLDRLRDGALAGKRVLSVSAWQAVFVAGDWVTEEGGSGITPVK